MLAISLQYSRASQLARSLQKGIILKSEFSVFVFNVTLMVWSLRPAFLEVHQKMTRGDLRPVSSLHLKIQTLDVRDSIKALYGSTTCWEINTSMCLLQFQFMRSCCGAAMKNKVRESPRNRIVDQKLVSNKWEVILSSVSCRRPSASCAVPFNTTGEGFELQ